MDSAFRCYFIPKIPKVWIKAHFTLSSSGDINGLLCIYAMASNLYLFYNEIFDLLVFCFVNISKKIILLFWMYRNFYMWTFASVRFVILIFLNGIIWLMSIINNIT